MGLESQSKSLLIGVITLILLIGILAGVTPTALTFLDNLSTTLVIGSGNATNPNGIALGSLLAVDSLGGILWFMLSILIVIGTIFLMIRGASGDK